GPDQHYRRARQRPDGAGRADRAHLRAGVGRGVFRAAGVAGHVPARRRPARMGQPVQPVLAGPAGRNPGGRAQCAGPGGRGDVMPSRATMARLALVPALTAALLAACSDGPAAEPGDAANEAAEVAAADPTDGGAVADWPAVHLDQVHEVVVELGNAAQRDYRFAVARFRETGWPVRELTAAELGRLGTTRGRVGESPTLEVVRDERWTLGLEDGAPVDSCLFRLEHGGRYSYADGSVEMSRALGDDAAAGDSAEPVAGGEILPRFPLDPSPGGADG